MMSYDFGLDDLNLELKQEYLNLLRELFPGDFKNITAEMITIKIARHLNDLSYELNKCTKNMQSTFNNSQTALIYCSTFDQRCGVIKNFITFVAKLVKNGSRRWCIT